MYLYNVCMPIFWILGEIAFGGDHGSKSWRKTTVAMGEPGVDLSSIHTSIM